MITNPLRLVIEGIGAVVQTNYVGQLKTFCEEQKEAISVTFVDDSRFWKGKLDLRKKFSNFKRELKPWAQYIDKSTREGRIKYEQLRADVVFIATPDFTHVEIAMRWLNPVDRCGQIFIEKPLDSDLDKSMDLLLALGQNDPKVRMLDHYRARILPIVDKLQLETMRRHLGGQVKGFTFYFLENGSGPPRIGPIENELRANTLKNGLILDIMPHIAAILSYFGQIETIRVTGLQAARYTFTGENGHKKSAVIKNETFAHVRFTFLDHDLNVPPMWCDAYLGKGIRGVRHLDMKDNVKLLEVHGKNSKKYRLDLRPSGKHAATVSLVERDGTVKDLTELIDDPYGALIRRIVRSKFGLSDAALKFDLPVETAVSILQSVAQIRHPLKDRKNPLPKYYIKKTLPTYHIGKGGKDAPDLEDVLEQLESVDPILPFM